MEWSHFVDKERYSKELKELARSNKTLNKPKKPLTPYMLFVREVSRLSYFEQKRTNELHLDKAESREGQPWYCLPWYHERGWSYMVKHF